MQNTTNTFKIVTWGPSIRLLCQPNCDVARNETIHPHKTSLGDSPILFIGQRLQRSHLAGMCRNNGSINEKNEKCISPCCSHNSISRSDFCVIHSHLDCITFPSFLYTIWLNLRLQWRFYVLSLVYLRFCLCVTSPSCLHPERNHVITCGVERKFPGAEFLTTFIHINVQST